MYLVWYWSAVHAIVQFHYVIYLAEDEWNIYA